MSLSKAVRLLVYGRWLLALLGAALVYFATLLDWFTPLDRINYDVMNELYPMAQAGDIVIVAIDEQSLRALGRWPWPREYHVELLRRLAEYQVAAVAIDVVFSEPDPEYPEVDALLAEALSALPITILPVFVARTASFGSALSEVAPIPQLQAAATALGHVHIEVDSDGVARSMFLQEGLGDTRWPHFALALARELGIAPGDLPGTHNTDISLAGSSDKGFINRDFENLIPFMGPVGTVPRVSFADVMSGQVAPQLLQDKIVFVGATAAGHVDNIATSLGQISGVEINVNIFQALRQHQLVQTVPIMTRALGGAVLAFLLVWLFTLLEPRTLLLAVVGIVVLLLGASFALFVKRYWWSPMPLILVLLLVYLLWNWLRLERALQVVRTQIALLQSEGRRRSNQSPLPRIERTLQFMQDLGLLERWQVQSSDEPISQMANQWRHEHGRSYCHVDLHPGNAFLELCWQEGQKLDTRQLHSLFATRRRPERHSASLPNVDLQLLEQAHREARHSRALTQSTMENLFSAVILADMSGSIVMSNKQAANALSLSDDHGVDLLGALKPLQLVDSPPMNVLLAELFSARSEGFTHEARIGRDAWYLCRGRVIDLEHPMLLIAFSDVTDLKRSELQRAEALNFLSHDLRAPLTSVLALLDSARKKPSDCIDDGLLDEIERYIQRNLSYAENYIYLSRLRHTEAPRQDECDAQSLLDNAVAQIYHAAAKRNISVDMVYADDSLWVSCNRVMMERALLNLLDNAIKYSPDGTVVTVSVSARDERVIFAVKDQGPGVNQAIKQRLFEAFSQGENASGGVGLGLRFVALAAQVHGGTVSVDNPAEGGCCFRLSLPQLVVGEYTLAE